MQTENQILLLASSCVGIVHGVRPDPRHGATLFRQAGFLPGDAPVGRLQTMNDLVEIVTKMAFDFCLLHKILRLVEVTESVIQIKQSI